jgi:hypothetical protein
LRQVRIDPQVRMRAGQRPLAKGLARRTASGSSGRGKATTVAMVPAVARSGGTHLQPSRPRRAAARQRQRTPEVNGRLRIVGLPPGQSYGDYVDWKR